MSYEDDSPTTLIKIVLGWLLIIVLIFALLFGVLWAWKAFSRSQKLAGAHNDATIARVQAENQTKVNELLIAAQGQKVQITKQEAQIRFEAAKGVREAQDEIAETLTPLYVQFEMVEALKAIATSGANNTVVYIPSGANGIPLVSTTDPTQVGKP